jgi:hypothetical protein
VTFSYASWLRENDLQSVTKASRARWTARLQQVGPPGGQIRAEGVLRGPKPKRPFKQVKR